MAVEVVQESTAGTGIAAGRQSRRYVKLKFADILKCDLNELHAELGSMRAPDGALRVAADAALLCNRRRIDLAPRRRASAHFDSLTMIRWQHEAAERVDVRRSARKQYCLLSALLSWHYDIEAAMGLPRGLFTPPPHVDSTLLRLTPRETAPAETLDHGTLLIKTMSAAFLMRQDDNARITLCAAFFDDA